MNWLPRRSGDYAMRTCIVCHSHGRVVSGLHTEHHTGRSWVEIHAQGRGGKGDGSGTIL